MPRKTMKADERYDPEVPQGVADDQEDALPESEEPMMGPNTIEGPGGVILEAMGERHQEIEVRGARHPGEGRDECTY